MPSVGSLSVGVLVVLTAIIAVSLATCESRWDGTGQYGILVWSLSAFSLPKSFLATEYRRFAFWHRIISWPNEPQSGFNCWHLTRGPGCSSKKQSNPLG
jgi:hypothetical protein